MRTQLITGQRERAGKKGLSLSDRLIDELIPVSPRFSGLQREEHREEGRECDKDNFSGAVNHSQQVMVVSCWRECDGSLIRWAR